MEILMLENDYMTWAYGFITVLLVVIWYALRCFFASVKSGFEDSRIAQKEILEKLERVIEQRTDCLIALPLRFADKTETKEELKKITNTIDNHDIRIYSLEEFLRLKPNQKKDF